MNQKEFEKVLHAIQYNLKIEEYDAARGIISLLEQHGFPQDMIAHFSGDIYVLESKYKEAIKSYEHAIKLYKKQGKNKEALCLEDYIKQLLEKINKRAD